MVPLSFVLACLLNLDSTRSPIVPKIDAINEITSKLVRDKKSQKYETKNAVINVKNTPPKKPSIVFFGETLSNNFLFPKFLPTKNAKLSLTQIKIINDKITDAS